MPKGTGDARYCVNYHGPASEQSGAGLCASEYCEQYLFVGITRGDYEQTITGYPRQVIDIASEGGTKHPTQKPVALMEYLIHPYTNEGEVVLDNCMGSGTTVVACMNTARRFVGIERDAEYFRVASERISSANA